MKNPKANVKHSLSNLRLPYNTAVIEKSIYLHKSRIQRDVAFFFEKTNGHFTMNTKTLENKKAKKILLENNTSILKIIFIIATPHYFFLIF